MEERILTSVGDGGDRCLGGASHGLVKTPIPNPGIFPSTPSLAYRHMHYYYYRVPTRAGQINGARQSKEYRDLPVLTHQTRFAGVRRVERENEEMR